jgi:hypothetical protein
LCPLPLPEQDLGGGKMPTHPGRAPEARGGDGTGRHGPEQDHVQECPSRGKKEDL